MTRYEQGFMRKCAEYGVDGRRLLVKISMYKKWPKLNKEFQSLVRRVSNAFTGKTDLSKFDTEKGIKLMAKRQSDLSSAGWHKYIRGETNVPPPMDTPITARERNYGIQDRLKMMIERGSPPEVWPSSLSDRRDINAAIEYITRRINDANKIID